MTCPPHPMYCALFFPTVNPSLETVLSCLIIDIYLGAGKNSSRSVTVSNPSSPLTPSKPLVVSSDLFPELEEVPQEPDQKDSDSEEDNIKDMDIGEFYYL